MNVTKFGDLRAIVTGGSDDQGGGTGPVVVLLHGFGAPADDLVSLGRVFGALPGARFVFPEAPLTLDPGYGNGRAWWHIQIERFVHAMERGQVEDLIQTPPVGLDDARNKVIGLLDEVESRFGVSGESIILGGFSQGAMLSCDVALRTRRPLGGVMMLSGSVITENQWLGMMPSRKATPFFMSHGDSDPLLPFMLSERLSKQLIHAGVPVTWAPFHGGHGIPEEVVIAANAFLKTVVKP